MVATVWIFEVEAASAKAKAWKALRFTNEVSLTQCRLLHRELGHISEEPGGTGSSGSAHWCRHFLHGLLTAGLPG